jgi:hypothetical protein
MRIAIVVFVALAGTFLLLPRLLAARPGSFRSRFARDRTTLLARPVPSEGAVMETDLTLLPPLMQTYLRRMGTVGRPRVRNVRVVFAAQMRSSATSPWMQSTATQ